MDIKIVMRSILSWSLLFSAIVVFFIPILIFMCIPKRIRYSSSWLFMPVNLFYRIFLRCPLVPIRYIGVENIPTGPVIFAGNHQSSLDIPLMGILSGSTPHVWLAKAELMDSVFIRFVVPLIAVLVDVTSARKSMISLRKVLGVVDDHGCNIMIFPEGARYTDGRIHDFFGGFVVLARKTGRPIVPVCIVGANKVYPPDTFLVHWHPIRVFVGKPFVLSEREEDVQFKKRVHDWFMQCIEEGS